VGHDIKTKKKKLNHHSVKLFLLFKEEASREALARGEKGGRGGRAPEINQNYSLRGSQVSADLESLDGKKKIKKRNKKGPWGFHIRQSKNRTGSPAKRKSIHAIPLLGGKLEPQRAANSPMEGKGKKNTSFNEKKSRQGGKPPGDSTSRMSRESLKKSGGSRSKPGGRRRLSS